MIRPRVSVLITNYNYAHFLRAAIDSALQQTYPVAEVIVVDDGSSDDSRAVIVAAAAATTAGRLIIPVLKENGGQGSAFNAGFARSSGDIVLLLDADDILSRPSPPSRARQRCITG
jgi:glycosyltransferase involved in cell wall biosynthesis